MRGQLLQCQQLRKDLASGHLAIIQAISNSRWRAALSPVGLLHAAGGGGRLAGRLGGELLAGRLATGGLAGSLLGTGHFERVVFDVVGEHRPKD